MPKDKDAHIWERDPLDWYVEPGRCTEQLLAVEDFEGWIHDPCCGGGNIVTGCLARGLTATGSDLVRRTEAAWFCGETDFLAGPMGLFGAPNCIFNPPFYRAKGAEACIRRALALATGKVAAFVDGRFLWGKDRAGGLYRDHPPSAVWFITPRPSCPPGSFLAAGGEASGGTPDFAWIVWDRIARKGATRMGWLT